MSYSLLTKSVLRIVLAHAHTSLNNVDNIVAKLFALLDDIHIHGTDSVGIEMVVDIVDVQLATIVVDFILNIERTVYIVV